MHKITFKSDIRPELQSIYFTPEKMVATDSFRLIEVKKAIDIKEPRLIKAKGFKGTKTIAIDDNDLIHDGNKLIQGERVDATYPDYEQIFPKDDQPRFTMTLNAKYLAELAAEVDAQVGDPHHKVKIAFYDPLKPLLITAERTERDDNGDDKTVSVRALVSPMNN